MKKETLQIASLHNETPELFCLKRPNSAVIYKLNPVKSKFLFYNFNKESHCLGVTVVDDHSETVLALSTFTILPFSVSVTVSQG